MPKVLTVVGARPQFIKAAVVSPFFSEKGYEEILVHTGQHYDYGMSELFFEQLSLSHPKINLGVSGGSHASMTSRMLVALEDVILKENPDVVLLYGDTNSTLAAALATVKLRKPIVHVEAGARTGSRTNPEEINRICTDHVSELLLACTQVNMDNLKKENLQDRAYFVGDPMYDAFLKYQTRSLKPELVSLIDASKISLTSGFYYLTCHREENTSTNDSLREIFSALIELDAPVVFPVHPRCKSCVLKLIQEDKEKFRNILCVEPVGYLESLWLITHAKQVITDSGGLQREAFFAGVKCTTILDFEVWPETMVLNRNLLAKPEKTSILSAMSTSQEIDTSYTPFGDGNAGSHIVEALGTFVERQN